MDGHFTEIKGVINMNDFYKTCLDKVEKYNTYVCNLGEIKSPKRYTIDCSKIQRLEDLTVIVSALCSVMTVSEEYDDFDKIKHLLKEVE